MNKRLPKLKKRTWLLIVTGLYLLLVNTIWPVRILTATLLGAIGLSDRVTNTLVGNIYYSTLHGEYTGFQERGILFSNTFEDVAERFRLYKQCHPDSPDTVLYRTYRFEPYMFWEVGAFLTQPEWKLPYLPSYQLRQRLKPQPACTCPNDWADEFWHNRHL